MKPWMFRCRDVPELISLSMDTPLPLCRRLGVRVHLLVCRYCSLFRRQLAVLRRLSRDAGDDLPETQQLENLSAEARTRIKERLRSAT